MDDPLSEVPLVEVVTLVLLVRRVQLLQEDHLVHQLSLCKTLVHEQIVLLLDRSMTSLTHSCEHLEPSSQSRRVPSLEGHL